ncbi:MAG: hypothetical protein ABL898_06920 [Hyphomicrobiaceae bacterium]|nr:GAF domain-containing protein [Hyphomicrobiaceae bacterium]
MTEAEDSKKRSAVGGLKTRLTSDTKSVFTPGVSARLEQQGAGKWHWLSTLFSSGNRVLPPRMAFVELAIFAFIILLEWQIDAFPDLTRMNPHPYWIAILLLSLQYGSVAGLAAAGLAIIGQTLIGMPEPDIEERYFNYLIRVWTQPVLWLLVALLLGAFRSRQIEKREFLKAQVLDLEARGTALVDYTNNLESRVATLERTLAVSARPTQNRLLSGLHALADPKPGRWANDLSTVLNAAMPRAAVSVAVADERGLRLVLTHNWPAAAPWRSEFLATDPLGQAILAEQRQLNVAERADESVLQGDGLVAIPIFQPGGTMPARVIGMLKIEQLDAALLDAATANRLAVIARHIAPALAQGAVQLVTQLSPSDAIKSADQSPDVASGATIETTSEERGGAPKRWRGLSWLVGGRNAGATDPKGGANG